MTNSVDDSQIRLPPPLGGEEGGKVEEGEKVAMVKEAVLTRESRTQHDLTNAQH